MTKQHTSDVIVIGAGIIGLSLGLELRDRYPGLSVTVLERGEPAREASWAAAGMLSHLDLHTPTALREIACYSAELYPAFVRYVEELSGESTGFSEAGALYVSQQPISEWQQYLLTSSDLVSLEPALAATAGYIYGFDEASVDPRALTAALLTACRCQGVEVHHEHHVLAVLTTGNAVTGVRTGAGDFTAPLVVNCAGAWAGDSALAPHGVSLPVTPVKGQMLAVLPPQKPLITHTIRSEDIYFLPRHDGHIVIGATVEHAGYDKRVHPEVIQHLYQLAANLVPALGQARITTSWAGLRPGTPDSLPLLGPYPGVAGYFLSTGHYRNGILLAPATAKLMAQMIGGTGLELDLDAFSPERFVC